MLIEPLLAKCMRLAVRRHLNMRWLEDDFHPHAGENGQARLLYVHIPFCETLCPYCSFYRVRFEPDLADRYFRALRREVEIYHELGFDFEAVYVGGGTPTVLPRELSSLIERIRRTWPVKRVSVETHPHHLTRETVTILRDAGVNRLSVGVQTFDGSLLEKLSRLPSPGFADEALDRLRGVRGEFDTVNVDMIYNFPSQTADMVLRDVRAVRDLEMDQVTFYPLMEGGADFAKAFGKVDARRERVLFGRIVDELSDTYEPVSAWCFARRRGMPDEYIVAHDEYAGLGSGAFGYVNGVLYGNSFDVAEYIATLNRSKLPIVAVATFPDHARVRYDLLMRLFAGSLDLSDITAKHGWLRSAGLWKERVLFLLAGAVSRQDGRFVLTRKGQYYCVILMKEFFSGINRLRDFLSPGRPDAPRVCASVDHAPVAARPAETDGVLVDSRVALTR